MRPTALALSALLLGSLVVGGVANRDRLGDDGAHEHGAHDHHDAMAHSHGGEDVVEGLFAFKPRPVAWRTGEDGKVPTKSDASALPFQFRSFTVEGDEGLLRMVDEGYVAGAGTTDDPFVIEGFRVAGDLDLQDLSWPLVIRNSYIEGQLQLNYVGPLVYVHHNRIHDLRVNENVVRDGVNTGGVFERNEIDLIGQLRHFGGEFHHNAIGPRPAGFVSQFLGDTGPQTLEDGLVWNFDGYHLAWVHNNTVLGFVDVKLHGHYHGSCVPCHPHNHAESEESEAMHGHLMDHTLRHHALDFENNTITVEEGRALRVNDRNHAGDDQTANSEPNDDLELPHEHHLFVRLAANRIAGGPVVFEIVNADDERHEDHVQEALVHLLRNKVTMDLPKGSGLRKPGMVVAYDVKDGTGMTLVARGNAYEFRRPSSSTTGYDWLVEPTGESGGFRFAETRGIAVFDGTMGSGSSYGIVLVKSQQLDLRLGSNRFNAEEEVHRAQ